MTALSIRPAIPGEEHVMFTLLHELAVYEKIADRFALTEVTIARDFFGPSPLCQCDLAFDGDQPVGVMTWYWIYSSFAASRGIFLEDLFVRAVHRGRGYGKALLGHLAQRAVREGARYIDWFVLDWNKSSIEFYERLRAEPVRGWLSYRLSGEALQSLGRV